MSTYYQHSVGLHNVGSYQVSGAPFVTGSTNLTGVMKIEFPTVTKSITFHELDKNNPLYFYFHEDATFLNKFVVDNSSHDHGPVTIDVKCKEVYVSGSSIDFRIYASLTGIDASKMYPLTGSGITE